MSIKFFETLFKVLVIFLWALIILMIVLAFIKPKPASVYSWRTAEGEVGIGAIYCYDLVRFTGCILPDNSQIRVIEFKEVK